MIINTQLRNDFIKESRLEPQSISGENNIVTKDSVLLLTGRVPFNTEERGAERLMESIGDVKADTEEIDTDLSKRVFNVRGLNDEITLKPIVHPKRVKEEILKALKREAEINAESVYVSADGGKVILTGKVNSWDERAEVARAAWNAPGVSKVKIISQCDLKIKLRIGHGR